MSSGVNGSTTNSARLLIIGLVAVIIMIGLVLAAVAIGDTLGDPEAGEAVDALASSRDECVVCHRSTTPGIVDQYGRSTMAAAGVDCRDCHEVDAAHAGAVEHEGTHVLTIPSTGMCENCHTAEVAQFNNSRHSLPAYVAYAGAQELSEEHLEMYLSIPEIGPDSEKLRLRNALFEIEGPEITRFACRVCHDIGKPHPDGSIGECEKCHLRHEFSLEQVRKPETCNQCHIGPDHPQWEIYHESPHGIAYKTGGHNWHWEAEPGTLTVEDFPAATCATCHFSGFGATGTSHDAGDRLTWFLFAPISERRPSWQDNKVRMQSVCYSCHNKNFIDTFYQEADAATVQVNEWVHESDLMVQPLQERGLMTDEPFDEPIDFVYFELWHHWGRTAKFGTWMQGPDYTQWHGAYELLADLEELEEMVDEKLEAAEAGTEATEAPLAGETGE